MAMELAIEQMPLPERIQVLKDAVLRARQAKKGATMEEAEWLDQLAKAEAQCGGTDVPLSGLIEQNPYLSTVAPAPESRQGDAQDPNTGESGGGA